MSHPLPWKNLAEMDRHFAASGRRSAARRERRGMRAAAARTAAVAAVGIAAGAGVVTGAGALTERLAAGSADAAPARPAAAAAPPARPAPAAACPVPSALAPAFRAAARRTGMPLALLVAVAEAESNFDPTARSSAGAYGTMQVLPSTGAEVATDVHHPATNILAGARYLRRMLDRFDGSTALALAAYHAGPTAVTRHGGAPYAQTAAYVAGIERRSAALVGACR